MTPDTLTFSGPSVYDGELEEYSFDAETTTVLAFFPGAFTGACTEELCTFRDQMQEFNDLGAEVIGISVDTPFALQEFAAQNDLTFRLVSDTDKGICEQYDVKTTFPATGHAIAERAVFVIQDGQIIHTEIMDDPHNLPDMDAIKAALAE